MVLDFEEVLTPSTRGRTPLDSPAFCPSGIVRGNLSPQASSKLRHLPCHGLTAGSVTSANLREKKRPVCPQTQVANRSGSVSEALFGGCGNAAGGTTCPPQGVQGHSPGTPLVPFVVKRKEPRVWAGSAHWWVLGLPAPLSPPADKNNLYILPLLCYFK